MNDDLISRSALRKDIEHLYSVYAENKDWFYTEVLDHIDNAKAVINIYTKGFADGERSGRIVPLTDEEKAIIVNQWRPKAYWKDHRWCSNCGCGIPTDVYGTSITEEEAHFCVECGARMEAKNEVDRNE